MTAQAGGPWPEIKSVSLHVYGVLPRRVRDNGLRGGIHIPETEAVLMIDDVTIGTFRVPAMTLAEFRIRRAPRSPAPDLSLYRLSKAVALARCEKDLSAALGRAIRLTHSRGQPTQILYEALCTVAGAGRASDIVFEENKAACREEGRRHASRVRHCSEWLGYGGADKDTRLLLRKVPLAECEEKHAIKSSFLSDLSRLPYQPHEDAAVLREEHQTLVCRSKGSIRRRLIEILDHHEAVGLDAM